MKGFVDVGNSFVGGVKGLYYRVDDYYYWAQDPVNRPAFKRDLWKLAGVVAMLLFLGYMTVRGAYDLGDVNRLIYENERITNVGMVG